MPKRKFQATEGLLHDVMRKQSGVIWKAWLEALMNSVDANASEFRLTAEETYSHISDDGDSMTKEEVEKYFEQFGLKDSDIEDKDFGKFRMGRGQIFNFGKNIWRARNNYMVVSLDEDSTTVTLEDCTDTDDESIIEHENNTYKLDTEGLSYALLDAEDHPSGIEIHVEHYQPLDDVDEAVSEFKNLAKYVSWLHGVDVYVNGDQVHNEPEIIEETELAFYCEGGDTIVSNSPVYNQGALVDAFNLGPHRIEVITKGDLDVTLDRTDILDTDEYWQDIKEEHKAVTAFYLIERNDISDKERQWLIERAADSQPILNAIEDKPIFKTIDNDFLTPEEVNASPVGFASEDDEIAVEAMNRGNVSMISEDYKDSFNTLREGMTAAMESVNVKDYEQVVDQELKFEMNETPDHKLSKRRLKHLNIIREALRDIGFRNEVKAGYSNHKNVWKNRQDVIYIHKDFLNKKLNKIATEVMQQVVIVASHNGETMSSLDEDYSLNRNFYKAVSGSRVSAECSYPAVQQRILDGYYP